MSRNYPVFLNKRTSDGGSSTGWGQSNLWKGGKEDAVGNQDSWSSKSNWNSGSGFGGNDQQSDSYGDRNEKENRTVGSTIAIKWRVHPELYVEKENANQAASGKSQVNANVQPLMILSSGKIVGNPVVNAKEQWKEVRDNRVSNGVNSEQNKTGKEIVPIQQSGDQQGGEANKQVQVANKFAVLEVVDEEDEPNNQLALVEAVNTPTNPVNGNQGENQQQPKATTPNTGTLNLAAPAFNLNLSGIGSSNVRVNSSPKSKSKEVPKTKESTAQWVERTFNANTGGGIVGINTSCQDIPSQDTMVDKELDKAPETQPDGTTSY
ncbi:hypothetical protein A4A49_17178 [Nicotiana attenuata]|uniref:Uncharacterized protein n=1 Tax=Nicotiana attenuata TaxID=49451 RepID=A0A314KIW6_NICAT|nr:hypothetical protein A4A49_17178 [Nicotiana attenuata]